MTERNEIAEDREERLVTLRRRLERSEGEQGYAERSVALRKAIAELEDAKD